MFLFLSLTRIFVHYMAGIYIHIPFCKSRCTYCGFYSTTSLHLRESYADALCRELTLRQDYLSDKTIETIYFGGGTPSLLSCKSIEKILSSIYNIYNVRAREITMECNPDDIANSTAHSSQDLLRHLRSLGINRLSIGIQTFNDHLLHILNRRHSAHQAEQAVHAAQAEGFDNISIDLMFGLPGQTLEDFISDLHKALTLGIQHLSVYSLTYEDNTPLSKQLHDGIIKEADEELSRTMYEHILDITAQNGFAQYEISNFSLPGKESIHNSNYWKGVHYMGIGAGAHSFNTESRQYNVESLAKYIKGANTGTIPTIKEVLTPTDKYNEFVLTALRTHTGLKLHTLQHSFGTDLFNYFLRMAQKHIEYGSMVQDADTIRLTRKGLFTSNDIMSDLMYITD